MSNELHALLDRVAGMDPDTAKELRRHVEALQSRREYGLNFERHTPESVALTGRPISVGDKVQFIPERGQLRAESEATWVVIKIRGRGRRQQADLFDPLTKDTATRAVEDLVFVADFRDPIHPGLVSTGRIEAGGDRPVHTVINAENFHALEALMFTHEGRVDCIYIDPPYNTRADDWKYNNDYVDPNDGYAHSKWLAFMERRLKLAVRLLNPNQSTLIVTIDEKEYLRLGLLMEQLFPQAEIRMISTVINPKGTGRTGDFARTNEYIFIARFGMKVPPTMAKAASGEVPWETMRRRNLASRRGRKGRGACGPNQFYPIFVDESSGYILGRGDALAEDVDRHSIAAPEGCVAVFPVRDDGTEMNWEYTTTTFDKLWAEGFIRCNGYRKSNAYQPHIIQFFPNKARKQITDGVVKVVRSREDGSVVAEYAGDTTKTATTQWDFPTHNAENGGTGVLEKLLPDTKFPYAKSLYAVEDVLRLFVADNPEAVVLDFFAGSGTTAHAVMRLNHADGGRRTSISVTNNEINDLEGEFRSAGLRPGDPDWEREGICEKVTVPRIRAAVTGRTAAGDHVEGDYVGFDPFPFAEGLEESVEFFRLTYENEALVEIDRAFERIAPLLWLKAGTTGRIIGERRGTYDLTERYGVLFSVDAAGDFLEAVGAADGIQMAFIVTNDESLYQSVAVQLPRGVRPVRLYESYLRTFEINNGRA